MMTEEKAENEKTEKAANEESKADSAAVVESWSALFYAFTQATTFHGMAYITQPTDWLCRRVLWVMIVLATTGTFTTILVIRLMLFYSYPSNVNVLIIYKDKMQFPDITICNQNFLRATRTYKEGLYDVVAGNFSLLTPVSEVKTFGICKEDEAPVSVYSSMSIKTYSKDFNTRIRSFANVTATVCTHLCYNWRSLLVETRELRECVGGTFDAATGLCQLLAINGTLNVNLTLTSAHDHVTFIKLSPEQV